MIRLSPLVLFGAFSLVVTGLMAAESTDPNGEMLASYVGISTALAGDDLAAAKMAASSFASLSQIRGNPDLLANAESLAKATKIEDARHAFRDLSVTIEHFAVGRKDFVVMYCPMAESDWVQATGRTQNPYLGKADQRCGKRKKLN